LALTATEAQTDVQSIIRELGTQIRIKYYNFTINAGSYDDDYSLTQSGTDYWTSGVSQPLSNKQSSADAQLLEIGKLKMTDSKLYISGDVQTSGIIKIGLGSPVTEEYSVLQPGAEAWPIGTTNVYKKVYIRYLPNGSLMGES